MSGPPSAHRLNSQQQIIADPDRLDSLVRKAIDMRGVDDEEAAEAVLRELPEDQREAYRQPLMDRLANIAMPTMQTSQVIELDDDELDEVEDAPEAPETPGPNCTLDTPPQLDSAPTIDLPPADRPRRKRGRKTVDATALPERIGKFRIKGELGRGAFGVVYLGYDDELQRNVAIKLSLVSDHKIQERLLVEARKVAQIESNGIVPVYDVNRTDSGKVYVVQKYIEGPTLREVLRNDGPMSPGRGVRLMREIALGLEPAHLEDILHRDLKPDNILISKKNGRAWIADFGLAISEEEQQGRKGELAGTPPYMSPEQIKGRVSFMDARSDIWALGVMYYELLCGKLPFSSRDRKQLTEQICEQDARPLHQRAPDLLNEAMHDVFARCCAKNPAERYASVREFAEALEALMYEGLSDQNIRGEVMPSRIGMTSTEYETTSQYRQSRRSLTSQGETQTETGGESTKKSEVVSAAEDIKPWWIRMTQRVAALAVVIGLSIAANAGFQKFTARDAEPDPDLGDVEVVDVVPTPPAIDPSATVADSTTDEAAETETEMESTEETAAEVAEADPQPPEKIGMGLDEANGSEEKPWVVSADGTGSHKTINDAIAASPDGAFITVRPGVYRESLKITTPITLVGEVDDSSGESKIVCNIRNDEASPLEVECPFGKVIVRNFAIDGEGHRTTKEFNAVDLRVGTLALENCEIGTTSHNNIKVRKDTTLGVRGCTFRDSRDFAISTKDQRSILVLDCAFLRSGVQVVGGAGRISGCNFYGDKGCYVGLTEDLVTFENCIFEGSQDFALAVSAGGKATAKNSKLIDCLVGLNIQAGELAVNTGSVIEGGRLGVAISKGKLSLTDAVLSELQTGVVCTDQAEITMENMSVERCREAAIILRAGNLKFLTGKIRDCAAGLVLGEESAWPEAPATAQLESVQINKCDAYGIACYSGPVELTDVTISDCSIGLYVQGPEDADPDREKSVVEVPVKNLVLVGARKYSLFAGGNCHVTYDGFTIDPNDPSKGPFAVEGAKVTEID